MDAATSLSEQLKRWFDDFAIFVTKVQALEDENETLKLKLLEIEKKETVPKSGEHGGVKGQKEHVNPHIKRLRRVVSESALSRQIPAAIPPLHIEIEKTRENSRMSDTVIFNSPENVLSTFDDIRVKAELVDEIIPDNLQTDMMDRRTPDTTGQDGIPEDPLSLDGNGRVEPESEFILPISISPFKNPGRTSGRSKRRRGARTYLPMPRSSSSRHTCEVCSCDFRTKRELAAHSKKIHVVNIPQESKPIAVINLEPPTEVLISCKKCSNKFKSKLALDIHECFGSVDPDMDENINIEIKEEEVGYGHNKSNSDGDKFIHDSPVLDCLDVGVSSPSPFKHEVDRSIQRMFRSADQVSNIEPVQNGVDIELNRSSSSHLTNVPLQEFVNPQPHMSSKGLRGRKVSYLTTRLAERIHRCVTCSGTFDTQFKLREHKKYHTGEKESRINPTTPHICSVCEKSFSRESALTNNIRDHIGEKPSRSLRIVKRTSVKRNLTAEKLNPGRPLKKQRKIEKEPEPNVRKKLGVSHDSPTLNIEKELAKDGRFDEFHTESLETQVQPLKRRFNNFQAFTMANREEQKQMIQMKGRGRYIVKFCGFCQKLMDSSTSFNDHVNRLHLYREFTQTGMDDETSGNSVLTTRLSRERPSNPPTGGGGELPTVLRDVRPPSGHRNVVMAKKNFSSTMIRPQCVSPEPRDYYGINAGGGLLLAVKYIPRRPNSLVARKSTSRSHAYPN